MCVYVVCVHVCCMFMCVWYVCVEYVWCGVVWCVGVCGVLCVDVGVCVVRMSGVCGMCVMYMCV